MVRLCAGLVAVLLVAGAGQAAADPATNLGTLPGGSGSEASAVNNAGVVVGRAFADGVTHAVRWDRQGRITDLGANAEAVRVNAYGEVAGTLLDYRHAARWDADGVLVDLGTLPGGEQSWAVSLNDQGVVVGNGYYAAPNGQFLHALRWDADGQVTDLGMATTSWSEAYAMNGSGVVVGVATTAAGTHSARWDEHGAMTVLDRLPGSTSSEAFGVSDAGTVVGQAQTGDGTHHAVRWDRKGRITDLGTLPGGSYSSAGSIGGGMIVGTSTLGPELYPTHAVRWNAGGISDLGVLPGTTDSYATRVNRWGTVIGRSGTYAAWWDRQGRIHQLDSAEFAYAAAINERNVAVGTAGGFAVLWRLG
jgi:probable HAF family extracellular repeat protein